MDDDGGRARLEAAAARLCSWGRWGDADERGTVNHITPEAVVAAARLVRRGAVFSLAIPYGDTGPQPSRQRRFNPMRFMLRDGTDAYARDLDGTERGVGGAEDVVLLTTQGATHWNALSHVFWDSKMWNGYDCRDVTSLGAERNDIAAYREAITGRAVLLDIPRHRGVPWCSPGDAVTGAELQECADRQSVAIGAGDIVLVRLGQLAQCRSDGAWGSYAGGDAPGLAFDSLDWIAEQEIAAVATDTWAVEVSPSELPFVSRPWHRVAAPQLGLLVGAVFDLEALAADCAADGVYEMFFSANPLPITGSVGGPVNPTAVK